MFKKVLIANRGEIAVRILKACKKLGIKTVAIYSQADEDALHVRYADEAYNVGPAPARESYLNIERIIDIAKKSGCEAIHPGYGFLAENPEFAARCQEEGIVFIGPPKEAIVAMGSKTVARQMAEKAGVPLIPGTLKPLSDEELFSQAREIGYPVMLKAVAGGGGMGMRLVHSEDEMKMAIKTARLQAKSAFNDDSLYLEKYIENPRHVEMQILMDKEGRGIYLGERECSIQRRHQKVIEEAPCVLVDEDIRKKMGDAALKVASAAGYYSAGTVEFLMDANRNFYFLEMNTRIQVEHPVTEMTTGVDLVEWQLRIADGEPLTLKQEEIEIRGHAIECRIYAEDPDRNFMPSPGKITKWQVPEMEGLRTDVGVYEGYTVSPYYDPLLAKFIAWGNTRDQAIEIMIKALEATVVEGIKTNIAFLIKALKSPMFKEGRITTNFIDQLKEE